MRLGEVTPHPVYAWMRWVQILSPTAPQYEALRPHLVDALGVIQAKWQRRNAG
jgi:hypothetical protein